MLRRTHQKETAENDLIYTCIQDSKIPRRPLNQESDSPATMTTDREGYTRRWGGTVLREEPTLGKYLLSPKTGYRVLTLAPEFPDSAQAWSGCGHGKDPAGLRWGEHKHQRRQTLPDCRPSEEPQEPNPRAHKHRQGPRITRAQKVGTPQPRAQHSRRPRLLTQNDGSPSVYTGRPSSVGS